MFEKIRMILEYIFGNKKRFLRLLKLIIVLSASIILIMNVGCGIKDGRFWFEWNPAKIEIKK